MLPFVDGTLRQRTIISDVSSPPRSASPLKTPSRHNSATEQDSFPFPRALMADKWIQKSSLDTEMKVHGKEHLALARSPPKSRQSSIDSLTYSQSERSLGSVAQDAEAAFTESYLSSICESPLSATASPRTVIVDAMCGTQCTFDPNFAGPLVVSRVHTTRKLPRMRQ